MMDQKERWFDRLPAIVLAVGTAILAVDVLVGWAIGAFDRTTRSSSFYAIALNLLLVVIAASAASAAIYQWRKRMSAERFIIDVAARLPEIRPKGPPFIPDITSYGSPALGTARIANIFADASAKAKQTYADAKPYAFALLARIGDVPTIRCHFEFLSAHAEKGMSLHWNNYEGLCLGHPGVEPDIFRGKPWPSLPWELEPGWERGYRMAYEKEQPLAPTEAPIVTAMAEHDGTWHYGFSKAPLPIYVLADDKGNVVKGTSVYLARLNVEEAFRVATRMQGDCLRQSLADPTAT